MRIARILNLRLEGSIPVKRYCWTLLVLPLFALNACGDDDDTTKNNAPNPQAALEAYSANLYAAYSAAVTEEQTFLTQVDTFLANPTESALTATRAAWLASRASYMLTEGARFYDGPIDIDPPNYEGQLNSWPLDEAYVDYSTDTEGTINLTVGLVNRPDLLPNITVEALDALNGEGGAENVSNGYHAIEFLLWGQALEPVGPGTRPFTDYTTQENATRRGEYLRVATQGVIDDLTAIRDQWAPGAAYRTQFIAGGLDSVGLVFTGLGKFSKGELSGERMNAPYASKSRRDQHDCFSSQTLVDYTRDAQGIQQIYLGTLSGASGASPSDLVAAVDADLDSRIKTQLSTSVAAMAAIPAPFEASIVGDDTAPGRVAIRTTINSLRTQGDLFADAAAALGVAIEVPDEN